MPNFIDLQDLGGPPKYHTGKIKPFTSSYPKIAQPSA